MNEILDFSHSLQRGLHQLIKAEINQRNFKQFVPLDLPIKKLQDNVQNGKQEEKRGYFTIRQLTFYSSGWNT